MRLGTVAVLVDNPALSSILAATLSASPLLRVRSFESPLSYCTYARIASVDIAVVDFDDFDVGMLGEVLAAGDQDLDIIGLSAIAGLGTARSLRRLGCTETLIKPMSPRYLLERVVSRMSRRSMRPIEHEPARPVAALPLAPAPRDWSLYGDNVVPLFG
jgi:two-component system phosphate regulon response regulator PhoB